MFSIHINVDYRYDTYMVTRTLHTCIQYLHGYQNTTYMYTVLTCTQIYIYIYTEHMYTFKT